MHPYIEYVNPHLGDLLQKIGMDKRFVRGEGCWLWDDQGVRYLDFIAAYGALPFGFNPPEIWAALHEVEASQQPSFIQPSALDAAGELARRLVEIAPPGLRYVTFTNSGAEAVEAAIKLARAATGRMGIVATENSFHGKTLGALSATGRSSYQQAFGAPIPGFLRIPFGDAAALEAVLAEKGAEVAAFIVEPVQGEGGIVVPPAGYLKAVREICDRHGVLLILDEIQSGLGRTGRLFACEAEGVSPDVMCVAKALGGGLLPIGAMLSTEAAYSEEFAMKHSSTFAGNTLACRVGIAALDLLTRDEGALLRHVAETGAYLKGRLQELQRKYPRVLTQVRGEGFMLGLEFTQDRRAFGVIGNLLGPMMEQEALTPVISGYLLNVERVRVAPTLNGANVIRIEPPLIATREMCDMVVAALDRTLYHVASANLAALVAHLVGAERPVPKLPLITVDSPWPEPSDDPEEGRFAFIMHPVFLSNYQDNDASLRVFSPAEMQRLADRFNSIMDAFLHGSTRFVSKAGKKVYGEFFSLPRTSEELQAMDSATAVATVRKAVEMARDRGAQIVGLGAYTSVVTHSGLRLKDVGVAVTTGNSYTVVAAVDAIYAAVTLLGTPLPRATIAVVGATGALGRAVTIQLSEEVQRAVLIGNPARPEQSRKRLLNVAGDMVRFMALRARQGKQFAPGSMGDALVKNGLPPADADKAVLQEAALALEAQGHLVLTTDIDRYLPQADLVVTATSSTQELVTPENLKYGAAVCDLSRPPNVSRAVKEVRPDVLVIDGGVVEVYGRPELGARFGFDHGLAYACMAETMLLGLEQRFQDASIGTDLDEEFILYMRQLGEKHGFRLAQLRSFDKPLSDEQLHAVLRARSLKRAAAV